MKKAVIVALLVMAGTMLIAGGYVAPAGSGDSAKVPCDDGDVYVNYKTKLMWQDSPYGDKEDGAYKSNRSAGKAGKWKYAKNYCSNLHYAGYSDWRLPKVAELTELHDRTRGLKNTIGMDFWSSTPSKKNEYWAVYAVFESQPYSHMKSDSHYIRCVRCID
ncbi:MAG: DUF1566 domain-containing protein [Campylobacterota bacterium]|nr:DUF1566 domain-containing protein [Campylobacterota bacterium]